MKAALLAAAVLAAAGDILYFGTHPELCCLTATPAEC